MTISGVLQPDGTTLYQPVYTAAPTTPAPQPVTILPVETTVSHIQASGYSREQAIRLVHGETVVKTVQDLSRDESAIRERQTGLRAQAMAEASKPRREMGESASEYRQRREQIAREQYPERFTPEARELGIRRTQLSLEADRARAARVSTEQEYSKLLDLQEQFRVEQARAGVEVTQEENALLKKLKDFLFEPFWIPKQIIPSIGPTIPKIIPDLAPGISKLIEGEEGVLDKLGLDMSDKLLGGLALVAAIFILGKK